MPVRSRAVEMLAHRALPGIYFVHGEPADPRWPAEVKRADETYVALIQQIDWNRVLIEAMGRHLAFEHGDDLARGVVYDQPCAGCIREALLVEDHAPDWRAQAAAAKAEAPGS